MPSLTGLLGAFMLVCAFVMLSQRQLSGMTASVQIQALALTACAFCQAILQREAWLCFTGFIVLVVNAGILPIVFRRFVSQDEAIRIYLDGKPVVSMVVGSSLVGIAAFAVSKFTNSASPLMREDLAISLSIILLGLATMAMRRDVFGQALGFLVTANGLVFVAIELPGLPFVAALSVALLVLVAFPLGAVFMFHNAGGGEKTEGRGP